MKLKNLPLSKLTSLLSLFFFGLALWLLRNELRNFRYRDIIVFFHELPAHRVVMAIAFTVLSYLALTCYDALALRYIGKRIAYWKVALASFAGYAFSNTLGMPLFTGTPLRARLYSGWGMTAIDITRVVLFSYITFWLGFVGLSGGAFLLEPIAVPSLLHLPMASARPVGVLFLGLIAAFLVASFVRRKPFTFKGLDFAVPAPPMAAAQIAIASLDWACAATVLYALLPSSWNITFVHFLGVFLFAQVAGLLSHVPGGLGVFESMMVLLMPHESPHSEADLLAAMVAFRGVYYFLPLLIAAVSLGAHEVVRRREQVGKIARIFGGRAPDVVPQILAVTTFLGGAILLISGATPEVSPRLSWLSDFLPLPVIELSHFAGSLAGAALLFLAIGLQRRLDAAYQLTLVMLGERHRLLARQGARLGRGADPGADARRARPLPPPLLPQDLAHLRAVHAGVERRHRHRHPGLALAGVLRLQARRVLARAVVALHHHPGERAALPARLGGGHALALGVAL